MLAYLGCAIGVDKSAPCMLRAREAHHRQREFWAKAFEIPA